MTTQTVTRTRQVVQDSIRRLWLADATWLLALSIFILAGVPVASFHPDEVAHIFSSNDYATLFFDHDINSLLVTETPGRIENRRGWERLLTNTVARYTIGLAWHLTGHTPDELPVSIFSQYLSYDENLAQRRRPNDALLMAARVPSALFLCVSVAAMFGIGWEFGRRPLAYLMSGLYALNPLALLQGRRALQEGAWLCFGLLGIYAAIVIARKRAQHEPVSWRWWAALVAAGGLALASKHTAILYVAAALAWIFAAEVVERRLRVSPRLIITLAAAGALIFLVYFALSPALWFDPVARLKDVVALRGVELERQVLGDPKAPTTLAWRVENMFTQPYLAPAAHYELDPWGRDPKMVAQFDAYDRSFLYGGYLGPILGVPLTALALLGFAVMFLPRLRPPCAPGLYAGIPILALAVAASLLVNPLPWQRYFLPMVPVAVMLSSIGLWGVVRAAQLRRDAAPRAGEHPHYALALLSGGLAASTLAVAFAINHDPVRQFRLSGPLPGHLAHVSVMTTTDPLMRYSLELDAAPGNPIELNRQTGFTQLGEGYFCFRTPQVRRICVPNENLSAVNHRWIGDD